MSTPRADDAAGAAGPIGILGGTFDPVHEAHLRIARLALDVLRLARVLWIPTGRPGYRDAPVASPAHRVAMLRLALAGEPRYAIDERELGPEASGYTVDTLAALRAELGTDRPLVLLMGDDQFAKLDGWHRWKALFELAHIAVFARPGWSTAPGGAVDAAFAARAERAAGGWRSRRAGAVIRVDMPLLDVSATALRARIGRGENVSAWLPPAVIDYIMRHRLYRTA
ncbi:MAG: nicotinate-nucleotide adenylyltransferase [Burkholderiales bacterium]|nr:nicotinate-nucleotide adenylyltransferase [Burkholderiales bacterium]